MNQFAVIIVVSLGCLAPAASVRLEGPPGENHIFDLRVYRIEAHIDDSNVTQVLTASKVNPMYNFSNRTIIATVGPWIDDPSQKWRLDRSALYSSFELHPTSNENFNLEYDASGNFFNWIGSWGFGYNKNWYLVDAGNGYHMIKNQYNEVCIKSMGLNKPLSSGVCDNSNAQQWRFVPLLG